VSAPGGRGDRLEALVTEAGLDSLLVTNLTNIRYLTGFTGTNALALVGPGLRVFLTDFRYVERAAEEVGEEWDRPEAERELLPVVFERAKGKVGYEDAEVTVRQLVKLEEKAPEGTELAPAGDMVEKLRKVKDQHEIAAIAAAAKLTDGVYEWAAGEGLAGRTESEVARAAEAKIRELGAEPSFPVIVAGGPTGAQPHAEPGERVIGAGELVVFDMGALLDGYCSDCTRTFAAGEPDDEAREIYELVRRAQAAALDAIKPGLGGKEADAVAREMIDDAGHGEHFGHSLGHGVGLEVHDPGPTLSVASEDELEAGNVVTVEPGVYLPGKLGVRIEDLVVVTGDGHRNLSSRPKELTVVD
jgi:Xaa-Pro aminopeptidase